MISTEVNNTRPEDTGDNALEDKSPRGVTLHAGHQETPETLVTPGTPEIRETPGTPEVQGVSAEEAAQAAQAAQADRWVLMRVHMEEHLLQDYLITCLIIY